MKTNVRMLQSYLQGRSKKSWKVEGGSGYRGKENGERNKRAGSGVVGDRDIQRVKELNRGV
jgi:ribosomal protein S6E (S10)